MSAFLSVRRSAFRKLSVNIVLGVLVALIGAGYIYLLRVQDESAVVDLSAIRDKNTPEYLEQVRHHQGFDAYVAKVSELQGYDRPKRSVPAFLLGRWAMFDSPQRVDAQFIAEDCASALAIEDGELKMTGMRKTAYPARYSISGSTVKALLDDGTIVPIKLVSYGMDLHHIEVTLPGDSKSLYGYLCK